MLARRDHSEYELMNKLRAREFPLNDIQPVITALINENLLCNTRFIENYIHFRRKKGIGPTRILAELKERGLTEELIEHHLDITDNAWFVEAKLVWQKKFKNKIPNEFKIEAQQKRFLYYRGFTIEQINPIFEKT